MIYKSSSLVSLIRDYGADQWFRLVVGFLSGAIGHFVGQLPPFILGLTIYVDRDSADVWSEPEIFKLDGEYEPEYIAGFPPDGFSDDGQMWGNPDYDWDVLADHEYD
jgi:hypothetical protein